MDLIIFAKKKFSTGLIVFFSPKLKIPFLVWKERYSQTSKLNLVCTDEYNVLLKRRKQAHRLQSATGLVAVILSTIYHIPINRNQNHVQKHHVTQREDGNIQHLQEGITTHAPMSAGPINKAMV